MGTEILERRFAAIGARLNIVGPQVGAPRIDVVSGTFDIRFAGSGRQVELEVVDVDSADRHLLLLVRDGDEKSKFLCGHDERHWFVAAVPDARGVTGVVAAKIALQPGLVQTAIRRTRPKHPLRRRNSAYVRQGEWFFVPAPDLDPPAGLVLRNEPLSRGRGKAHMIELAHRRGGHVVWANRRHPSGISDARYRRLTAKERQNGGWTRFVADPELFAKGAVRHPDHATIVLRGWHRVAMNTEQGARAMRHVVFLD